MPFEYLYRKAQGHKERAEKNILYEPQRLCVFAVKMNTVKCKLPG